MSKRKAEIVDCDGVVRDNPDFPIAIIRVKMVEEAGNFEGDIVDPVFNDAIVKNLYGRIITLVEATTDSYKLKAVKDLFSKEIKSWSEDVYSIAFEKTERARITYPGGYAHEVEKF